MGIYKIAMDKCDGSPYCPVVRVCEAQAVEPTQVVSEAGLGFSMKYQINRNVCLGCGKCALVCPRQAVYPEG